MFRLYHISSVFINFHEPNGAMSILFLLYFLNNKCFLVLNGWPTKSFKFVPKNTVATALTKRPCILRKKIEIKFILSYFYYVISVSTRYERDL